MNPLVDTHCHLPLLEHTGPEEALERARAQNVVYMVTVATELNNWERSRECAEKFEGVFYTVGLHPHEARYWPECATVISNYFPKDRPLAKCVGIGETGLDFHYDYSPREIQIDAFESQLQLAKKWDVPIVIHCRDAFAEVFSSVKKIGLCSRGGVMHCFTGDKPNALDAVDLGLKISFSGILTFKNADSLRSAARALPAESLLLETDCPYLAPVPMRGKPNEPSYLPHTASLLASIRGSSVAEIANQTTQNAVRLFGLQ